MAICDQLHKFESLFTGSLKKALSLPEHLPNERLVGVVGIPTLTQIASNHVRRNWTLISQRFGQGPSSLDNLAGRLNQYAVQYNSLNRINDPPEGDEAIEVLGERHNKVDLRAISYALISKELLGLATGVYLTLRHKDQSALSRSARSVTFQVLKDTFWMNVLLIQSLKIPLLRVYHKDSGCLF